LRRVKNECNRIPNNTHGYTTKMRREIQVVAAHNAAVTLEAALYSVSKKVAAMDEKLVRICTEDRHREKRESRE
jgi:hypothetical protein